MIVVRFRRPTYHLISSSRKGSDCLAEAIISCLCMNQLRDAEKVQRCRRRLVSRAGGEEPYLRKGRRRSREATCLAYCEPALAGCVGLVFIAVVSTEELTRQLEVMGDAFQRTGVDHRDEQALLPDTNQVRSAVPKYCPFLAQADEVLAIHFSDGSVAVVVACAGIASKTSPTATFAGGLLHGITCALSVPSKTSLTNRLNT